MKRIGTDFQGWPIYAMTLREILKALGFEEDTETVTLIKSEETNRLLDSYPYLLEDDGMGYGVNGEYITEADTLVYNQKIKTINVRFNEETLTPEEDEIIEEEIPVFNIFRDVPENKTDENE